VSVSLSARKVAPFNPCPRTPSRLGSAPNPQ
jgi:hypothetical protein